MAGQRISQREWTMIHRLAAELAQRDMDDNLVQSAAAYMKANPEADFQAWLTRLVQLGDLFGSSLQTGRYWHELWAACRRLEPQPQSGAEWATVLAWAARMQRYYETNMRQAVKISDVRYIDLPAPPPAYYPNLPAKAQSAPPVKKSIDDKPPSQEAEDLFARMQDRWEKKKKGK